MQSTKYWSFNLLITNMLNSLYVFSTAGKYWVSRAYMCMYNICTFVVKSVELNSTGTEHIVVINKGSSQDKVFIHSRRKRGVK